MRTLLIAALALCVPALGQTTTGTCILTEHGYYDCKADRPTQVAKGIVDLERSILEIEQKALAWKQRALDDEKLLEQYRKPITFEPCVAPACSPTTLSGVTSPGTLAIIDNALPLTCPKYQHVEHGMSDREEQLGNNVFRDAEPDRCVDDLHWVTEREWQDLQKRLNALEATSLHFNPDVHSANPPLYNTGEGAWIWSPLTYNTGIGVSFLDPRWLTWAVQP